MDGDGLLDLVVHIETATLSLTEGESEAVLHGQTNQGKQIRGSDSVRIVP
ncbi:MAG: hypothetical protein HY705_05905 [Gemmatimonadetes bacterium]|nr:hypothetical protein [Gemmatimonadota bacterium]